MLETQYKRNLLKNRFVCKIFSAFHKGFKVPALVLPQLPQGGGVEETSAHQSISYRSVIRPQQPAESFN